jgi:hypothetical protein
MSIVTLNDRGVRSVSAFGSVSGGSMVFIKKLTASSSSTLSFVNGSSDVVLDSTYKEYLFTFKNLHPSSDSATFTFQGSTDTGSNYNTTLTSSYFEAYHAEGDGAQGLGYEANKDLAQSTSFQPLFWSSGSDNDESGNGVLRLFNPSSTTFVKHFIHTGSHNVNYDYAIHTYMGGYFNTTSAIDAVQFKYASGNIDAGDICLYGIN